MPGLLNFFSPKPAVRKRLPPPRPHKIQLSFGPDIPRHWVPDRPSVTHLANSLGLIFPSGERFFVRTVRTFLEAIEDAELKAAVHGFMGQEMHHAIQHERFYETLKRQGYQIETFLRVYEKVAYGLIEHYAPPKVRLATTAALEHFTAAFAAFAFRKKVLDAAHPVMRELFLWHAAEELEHKAVAFDLLQAVDSRYSLRLAGLALAVPSLLGFWLLGGLMLLAQERDMAVSELLSDFAGSTIRNEFGAKDLVLATATYLLPTFHPGDIQDPVDARHYLSRLSG